MERLLAAAVLGLALQDGGHPDGKYERRHENGELAASGEYLDGRMHGEWRTFHPDGGLRTSA